MLGLIVIAQLAVPIWRVEHDSDDSAYGQSIAFCGDLDGDGHSEIAIGSPRGGNHGEGVVLIYSGNHYNLIRVLRSEISGSRFGTSIAAIGDQDGDGVPDLAVSAPSTALNGDSGEVQVRSGKTGACIRRYVALPDEVCFGMDLAAIGDIDGDKHQDLLIHCHVGREPQQRERFVVIGSHDGNRLNVITGPPELDCEFEGRPVASLLDIDGDGVPDYAIELGRQVRVVSGKSGADILKLGEIQPPSTRDCFGAAI